MSTCAILDCTPIEVSRQSFLFSWFRLLCQAFMSEITNEGTGHGACLVFLEILRMLLHMM